VSLIILNATFQTGLDDKNEAIVNRALLNKVFKDASETTQKDLLIYTERQNVSVDMIGSQAAVTIEAHETDTKTGFIPVPREALEAAGIKNGLDVKVPVTHAKIFGWYDNELGSYVNCLSRLISHIDKNTP
jgi:glyceraldehyde 3-phosphate dehydrogenase